MYAQTRKSTMVGRMRWYRSIIPILLNTRYRHPAVIQEEKNRELDLDGFEGLVNFGEKRRPGSATELARRKSLVGNQYG